MQWNLPNMRNKQLSLYNVTLLQTKLLKKRFLAEAFELKLNVQNTALAI